MAQNPFFTHIDAELLRVFEELRRRKPIFDTPKFGTTLVDFESATAPDYWDVGASGRRYNRDFILRTLEQSPPVDATAAGWQSSDYGLRRLGPDTYLFTYTLTLHSIRNARAAVAMQTEDARFIHNHI